MQHRPRLVASASIACALLACDAPLVSVAPPLAPLASPVAPVADRAPVARVTTLTSGDAMPTRAAIAKRQWDNAASMDGDACRAALADAGARFLRLPDVAAPDKKGCGVPHGVILIAGPSGMTYSPPLHVDCALALDLLEAEAIVQDEAEKILHAPIARVRTLGGFACRDKRGWIGASLSEHSFGMAADLAAFEPKRGTAAIVARDYAVGDPAPAAARARFLREVFVRLRQESSLAHAIGPDFNAAHRDHFHVDHGLPWWVAFTPTEGTEG